MLFGTSRRLGNNPKEQNLTYNQHTKNCFTTTYKYLGVKICNNLNFSDNFSNNYKKAASRLQLIYPLSPHLTQKASTAIGRGATAGAVAGLTAGGLAKAKEALSALGATKFLSSGVGCINYNGNQADIFSLGVLLFISIIGNFPFV